MLCSIGVFYWMLLNVHPAYRSSLHSIQLLAVVKRSCIKQYGIDAALQPVVQDLILATDVGLCLCLCLTYSSLMVHAVLYVNVHA